MHPYLDHSGVIAFAHRGGALEAPENTMRAFEHAVRLGYKYIETDAYATRDGVLLAFHDNVLDRVTDRVGAIAELDYAEIARARIAGTESIPLMEDVLATWPDLRVNIEPKSDGAVDPLIRLLIRHDALDRVCVGSFSGKRVQRIRKVFGERLCTAAGPWEVIRLWLSARGLPGGMFEADCAQVPLSRRGVTVVDERFMAAARERGLPVHIWTVDDKAEMERLIDLGATGIMTDRPALLKEVLEMRGLWS
jgi:glycerophosphoryl diester phosphodiesterase